MPYLLLRDEILAMSSGERVVNLNDVRRVNLEQQVEVDPDVTEGSVLDDRVGKRSERDKTSTKLLVRNVAFEATEKDLRQLFSTFGQIKSLKLPKRDSGQHLGFAFAEFVTKQEALNAKEALSSTYWYGRRLVLEWAYDASSISAF